MKPNRVRGLVVRNFISASVPESHPEVRVVRATIGGWCEHPRSEWRSGQSWAARKETSGRSLNSRGLFLWAIRLHPGEAESLEARPLVP